MFFGSGQQLLEGSSDEGTLSEEERLSGPTSSEAIPSDEDERLGKPGCRRPNVESSSDEDMIPVVKSTRERFSRRMPTKPATKPTRRPKHRRTRSRSMDTSDLSFLNQFQQVTVTGSSDEKSARSALGAIGPTEPQGKARALSIDGNCNRVNLDLLSSPTGTGAFESAMSQSSPSLMQTAPAKATTSPECVLEMPLQHAKEDAFAAVGQKNPFSLTFLSGAMGKSAVRESSCSF